jgi:hypothetical protein
MTNQEIITALQNDGFLVTTDEDQDSGIELIFFSKDGGYGKVDCWIHIEGVTDSALLVLRANQYIENTNAEYVAIKDRMSKNYDEFA